MGPGGLRLVLALVMLSRPMMLDQMATRLDAVAAALLERETWADLAGLLTGQ